MVDDASPDDSLAVMRELHVVVVALAPRRGQNAALLAGLRRARQPLACVMDADLQDPPEAIPLLLEPLERTGVRVVFSSREAAPRASSRLFRAVIRLLYPCRCRAPRASASRSIPARARRCSSSRRIATTWSPRSEPSAYRRPRGRLAVVAPSRPFGVRSLAAATLRVPRARFRGAPARARVPVRVWRELTRRSPLMNPLLLDLIASPDTLRRRVPVARLQGFRAAFGAGTRGLEGT